MASKKLPTQADLKAAMDIIEKWSRNPAPGDLYTPPPGVYVDCANNKLSQEDLASVQGIFAVDRTPDMSLAAGPEEYPMQRPFVTRVDVSYDAYGPRSSSNLNLSSSGPYSDTVTVRIDVELPTSMNAGKVVEELRRGDFSSFGASPPPAAERALPPAPRIRDMELELAHVKKEKEEVEKTLLQLRRRMNMAMDVRQDRDSAVEMYSEIIDRWSFRLAEGATFTAAEGHELVDLLVSALEYMDMARETRRLQHAEHEKDGCPPPSDDTLF